ncbi:MAG TPA: TetR/AcrR family transcriptional regulator [Hypericibacter adhaerens]|jgi:AcrR family transcriptional regulator|uniref:TetR/AcrR family transcriptional regulator n=1 Tax=Hypericibacter adhaerens TaxID=2602016 RepID=UPI002C89E02E|nr:TetR/AcrR family transcriptional regulator [Hypericibacter adhaerens]HWA42446.1 TetR/AcrR family transcriptional regulator [Hypericibacter adhaerens]
MAGLRERQKAGRRRSILAAAENLFRRDGFDATPIDAIAEQAEVAAGTVYNHFESKGDLLLALVARDGEEVRATGRDIIADPPKDPVQAVRRLLEHYVDHSLVHLSKSMWRNAMATALTQADSAFGRGYAELDRKLADQVGDLLRMLQARGQIDTAVDCRSAGDLLFAACNSLFMHFVAREERTLAELKREMARQVRVAFTGLLAPRG